MGTLLGQPHLHAHHFNKLCGVLFYGQSLAQPFPSFHAFTLTHGAAGCIFVDVWGSPHPSDRMLLESHFFSRELSQSREDASVWARAFLPVSREGGGQCDFPSPSVNGPMENSSL